MHGKRQVHKHRPPSPMPQKVWHGRPKHRPRPVSGIGTSMVLLLSLPLAIPIVFMALDGLGGQRLSKSAGASLTNVTVGASAGERSVVRAQRDADLQKSVTGTALTVATGAQIGDLTLCAGETIIGGILQYQADYSQLGVQMQNNCRARQNGMQGQVQNAARSSLLPELSGN